MDIKTLLINRVKNFMHILRILETDIGGGVVSGSL